MIEEAAAESRWTALRVGTVNDEMLFSLDGREVHTQLSAFDVVQYKRTADSLVPRLRLAATGFAVCDTQVEFRIRIPGRTSASRQSALTLSVTDAESNPFKPSQVPTRPFEHDRFTQLNCVRPGTIKARYANWADDLADRNPKVALRVSGPDGGDVGWFCASPDESATSLHLTLAAAARDTPLSGLLLYEAALYAFRDRGYAIGHASFSVSNSSVHNIYAQLGARFLGPTEWWMWEAARA